MAVATPRTHETVRHLGAGASHTTRILRVPVGLDDDDYQNLPLEVFLDVEHTGEPAVDEGA